MGDFLKWTVVNALRMISWFKQTLEKIAVKKDSKTFSDDYKNMLSIIDEAYIHEFSMLDYFINICEKDELKELELACLVRRQIREHMGHVLFENKHVVERISTCPKIVSSYYFTDPALANETHKQFNEIFGHISATLIFHLDSKELRSLVEDCCKSLPETVEQDYTWVEKKDSYLPEVLEVRKSWTE